MEQLKCSSCGASKFIKYHTWWECWYCGSEHKPPENQPSFNSLNPFPATYFTPGATYAVSNPYDAFRIRRGF